MQALRHADSDGRQIPTVTPVVQARRLRHPAFFSGMSVLLITLVFAGFAPTYYLRPADAVPLPVYVQVHDLIQRCECVHSRDGDVRECFERIEGDAQDLVERLGHIAR